MRQCCSHSGNPVIKTELRHDDGHAVGVLAELFMRLLPEPHCYAGAAFIALSAEERARFFSELERLATSWALLKSSRMNDVKWCHPKLTVEVKHVVGSETLRHATVRNFTR